MKRSVMKKIIAFSGSNSSTSINQQLIIAASSMAKNTAVEVVSLRDFEAPIFGTDLETESGFPESMKNLFEKMTSADGFIVSTPEHNGFMPAVLKNTIDWLSRMGRKVFNDKPVVFLSSSPGGRGGASALGQMLAIMPHQGAKVIGGHSVGSFFDKFKDGALLDGEDKEAILKLVNELEQAV
ncbi:MAG: chromate reductase [Salibacteraceae bacterium]|jgi:NAD(P)H-dependent FMN reductase